MSEEFDIGPLTWVKDEIDHSLNTVLENLEKLSGDVTETAPLRSAKTHLYQASGALDMVGLEGCKFYATEVERCLTKLDQAEIELSVPLVEQLMVAIKALQTYLNGLMQGASDLPLKLFDDLAPIVSATGRELEKSELFFVDTSFAIPKDVPTQEVAESEYQSLVVNQRTIYQKSLLQWLQTKQDLPLKSMVDAVKQVCYIQTRKAPKTLWWTASAFVEALSDAEIAVLPAAKRLCRKVDQELKLLQDAAAKANPQMLKDLLFFIAMSRVETEAINLVKHTFNLSDLIQEADDTVTQDDLSADKLAAINSLLLAIQAVDEIWNTISDKVSVNLDAGQGAIEIDQVLMAKCVDALEAESQHTEALSKLPVVALYDALSKSLQYLSSHQESATQPTLIELAMGIKLLTTALTHYADLDANKLAEIEKQTHRLSAIASGEVNHQFDYERSSELDPDTLNVVVAQIQSSLKTVEQALDAFFRQPENKSLLTTTLKPITEVSATFHMLDRQVAADIATIANQYIQYFESTSFISNEGEFELLAESLSMLGMYAEEMPRIQPEYEEAMQSALARMQTLIADKEIPIAPPEETLTVEPVVETVLGQGDGVTDAAFDDELLNIYLLEADEVLAEVTAQLSAFKAEPNQEALVEIRRGYHTLKGSGRTVGLMHVGDIAGYVESFLNKVIDKAEGLNAKQIERVEQMTTTFGGWALTLKDKRQLQFKPEGYEKEVAEWAELTDTKQSSVETVMIGGKRSLSQQFFNIFLNESMVNITILEQDLAKVLETKGLSPSEKARHAIHTLSSNALAAGFQHMGTLGRAAELWIDETQGRWTSAQQKIYSRLIKAMARMWQSVSEHKEPNEQKALFRAIQHATPSLQEGAVESTEIAGDAGETETGLETQATQTPDVQSEMHSEMHSEVQEDTEIVALFMEEADELLPAIGNELRSWNREHESIEHADGLQRALHTLKGSARMANKHDLGDVVHNMEERIVQALKSDTIDKPLFDYLFADLDNIAHFVDTGHVRAVEPAKLEQPSVDQTNQAEEALVTEPEQAAINDDAVIAAVKQEVVPEAGLDKTADETAQTPLTDDSVELQPQQGRANRQAQFVRMRADNLDRLINDAGEVSIIRSRIDKELVGFKSTSNDLTENVARMKAYLRDLEIEAETQLQSRLNILQEANEDFDPLEFDRFTHLQELTRMMAESVNDITTIQQNLVQNLGNAEAALQQQSRMNRELQQGLMNVRMLPFSQLSDRLYRLVRQTAKELGKEVSFKIEGEETAIDRSVLEKVGAPLEHLLRNAIAHGLEKPKSRLSSDKPEKGSLKLIISAENEEIKMVIQDDGAGINLKKVKKIGIKNKLIAKDAEVSDQALTSLIFETGFSTSDEVTQIAGRGVGLDVVRNEVTGLGGRIDVESQAGHGTQFSIFLPVTLSVAQVLMVAAQGTTYAVSVNLVEQAQTIKLAALKTAYDHGYVEWADNRYPIYYLTKLLGGTDDYVEQSYASVLLVKSGSYRIALHIDEMLGNQEVVVKEIGAQLARVPGVTGATVTGEGDVTLILNPVLLANREVMSAGALKVKVKDAPAPKAAKLKALVVDDSLTMRKVLSRLMEREGYDVTVAKDGMDAMQLLQESTPDIVLTDIEMPRMDGFGLARNIRDDERTKHTPLIMISSRTAEKHQNLAKEIGVNAFFGKPVQDEELMTTVKSLLA